MFNFNPENHKPLEKIKKVAKAGALLIGSALALNGGEANAQDNTLPTRQDSIDLLNSTNELKKYYQDYESFIDPDANPIKELEGTRAAFEQEIKQRNFPATSRNIEGDKNIKINEFYHRIDENKFKQRESSSGMLDLDAPMALYDKRIQPARLSNFTNNKVDEDVVLIHNYDPLQVTPWDMLSPQQQKERREKFGDAGTPFEQKPQKSEQTKIENNDSLDPITEEIPVKTVDSSESSEFKQTNIENKETPRDALIFRGDIPNWEGFRYSKKDNVNSRTTPPSNSGGGLCFYYDKVGNAHVITRQEFKRRKKLIEEEGEKARTKILIDVPEDK